MTSSAPPDHAPIVVGGTTSFGIALMTDLLAGMGIHMQGQAALFGAFFDHWSLPRQHGGVSGEGTLDPGILTQAWVEMEQVVAEHLRDQPSTSPRWGWAEARSALTLPFLRDCFPGMVYIHVVEDGRNQSLVLDPNEPDDFFHILAGRPAEEELSADQRARIWNRVNMGVLGLGPGALDRDLLIIRLEDLAAHAGEILLGLREALFRPGDEPDDAILDHLIASVEPLPSPDYWQTVDPDAVRSIEERAADGLFRFGYQPSRAYQALPAEPPVLVLAPHRGGGSAMAGALEVSGHSFGIALMNDDPDHMNGSWANERITAFNDRLLAALGSGWDDPGAVDSLALLDDDLLRRFRALISEEFGDADHWAVKDPRLCKLLPLWLKLLGSLWSEPPKAIIILRAPIEAARSLAKRQNLSEDQALALWMSHMIDAEMASRDLMRVVVSFDALLTDPGGELRRLTEQLQLTPRPENIMREAADWIDPSLRHDVPGGKRKKDQPTITDFWKGLQRLIDSDTAMNQWHTDGLVKAWRGSSIPERAAAEYKARTGGRADLERRTLMGRLAENRWRLLREGALPEVTDVMVQREASAAGEAVQHSLVTPADDTATAQEGHQDPGYPDEIATEDAAWSTAQPAVAEPAQGGPAQPELLEPDLGEPDLGEPESHLPEVDEAVEIERNEPQREAPISPLAGEPSPLPPPSPAPLAQPRSSMAQLADDEAVARRAEPAPEAPPPEAPRIQPALFPGYAEWTRMFDQLNDRQRAEFRKWAQQQGLQIKMAVIVWGPNGTPSGPIRQSLESLEVQLHPFERIILRAPSNTKDEDWQDAPEGENRLVLDPGANLADWLNTAVALAKTDWVFLLRAGTRLHETAHMMIAGMLKANPEAAMLHADFDHLDRDGLRTLPVLKGRIWDPDLHLGRDQLRGGFAFRRNKVDKKGVFLSAYDDQTVYEASLRLTEQWPRSAMIHVPHILGHAPAPADDRMARRPAVAAALARRKRHADIIDGPNVDLLQFRHAPSHPRPKVTMVMVVSDQVDDPNDTQLRWNAATDYEAVGWVLVDNTTTSRLHPVTSQRDDTKVIKPESPLPFWKAVSLGLTEADGEFLCLVDPDLTPRDRHWLEEMVGVAQSKNVGLVGAKTYRNDERVDQAGLVLGLAGDLAGPLHRGQHDDELAARGEGHLLRQTTAIDPGCLMIRRSVLDEVSGFDTEQFPVAHADLDLLLRLEKAGRKVMWTPLARLIRSSSNHLSPSLTSDRLQLAAKWSLDDAQDPYFSLNYSLESTKPVLAFPPRSARPWQYLFVHDPHHQETAASFEYALAGEETGAWTFIARRLLAEGSAQRALELARASLRLEADDQEARLVLCQAHARLGQWDEALQIFETFDQALIKRQNLDAQFAAAMVEGGVAKMARPFAEKALARNANNIRARLTLARCLEEYGDQGSARLVLENGTEEFPENHALQSALGHIRLIQGDHEAALPALQRAMELGADTTDLHVDLAGALHRNGKSEAGSEVSLRGIYRHGLTPELALIHGECLLAVKRTGSAVRMLTAGYRMAPNDEQIAEILFPLLRKLGRSKEAKRLKALYESSG